MTLLLLSNLGYAWGVTITIPSSNDTGMSSSKLTRFKRKRRYRKGAHR